MHVDSNEEGSFRSDDAIPDAGQYLVWEYDPDIEYLMQETMVDEIDDCDIQCDKNQYWTTNIDFPDIGEVQNHFKDVK